MFGADTWSNIFTPTLAWYTLHTSCEQVPDGNSLDAEIYGCSMYIGSLKKWVGNYV